MTGRPSTNVVRLPAGRNGQSPRPAGRAGTGDDFSKLLPDLNRLTKGMGLDPNKVRPLDVKSKQAIVKFEKEFAALRQQVSSENVDFRSDVTKRALYRAMLEMLLELVPLAQQKYYEQRTEGAAYTMIAIINKVQDLQTAINMAESLEEQAKHISESIYTPMMIQVANNLVSGLLAAKGRFDNHRLGPQVTIQLKSYLDDMVREHALYLRAQGEAFAARVEDYLLGNVTPPSKTGPGQGKRRQTKR